MRTIEDVVDTIVEFINRGEVGKAVDLFESLDPPISMDVIIRLYSEYRRKLFASASLTNIVPVLARLPDDVVFEIATVKGVDDLAKMLVKLHVDEIADILFKLPSKTRLDILKILPQDLSAEVAKVMKFPPESVGGVMTTQVPVFDADMSVGGVIDVYIHKIKLGLYDKHNYIYAVDKDRKLVGYIDLKTLLTKPRDLKFRDCVEKVKVHIDPFSDREEAAKLAVAYDLIEVPVVDIDGKFLGIVTLDDILDVVVSEHTEDLLKYGGIIEVIKGSYITSNPLKLALRRIPMIIYLYLVNIITGGIVASFEEVIQRIAILAAFMPILADNSGNIGSQASALILRGLVTGELKVSKGDIIKVLLKEFTTTTFMLLLLAPLAFAIGFAIPFLSAKNIVFAINIALTVTIALATSCYVADIAGALLPILLAKIRIDPATASAPVVTSIGDIVTVLTYFTIASVMLHIH
jgi:magnesium transporter